MKYRFIGGCVDGHIKECERELREYDQYLIPRHSEPQLIAFSNATTYQRMEDEVEIYICRRLVVSDNGRNCVNYYMVHDSLKGDAVDIINGLSRFGSDLHPVTIVKQAIGSMSLEDDEKKYLIQELEGFIDRFSK